MSMARGNRPVYVISIAASIAGCHPRTLRIYEEEGLVDPVRTDSNIRLYSDEDLQRVAIIRYLTQRRGVNLAGVKMLLQFRDAADLLREIAAAIDEVEADEDQRPAGPGLAGPGRAPNKGMEL
jgi:MerR family transcriptional regulator/heat shock protein HspR